jgi:hypothetical protein
MKNDNNSDDNCDDNSDDKLMRKSINESIKFLKAIKTIKRNDTCNFIPYLCEDIIFYILAVREICSSITDYVDEYLLKLLINLVIDVSTGCNNLRLCFDDRRYSQIFENIKNIKFLKSRK